MPRAKGSWLETRCGVRGLLGEWCIKQAGHDGLHEAPIGQGARPPEIADRWCCETCHRLAVAGIDGRGEDGGTDA